MPHTHNLPSRSRSWTSLFPFAAALSALWLPAVSAEKSAADYYVHSLPGAPEPLLKMFAGHIEVTPEHHGNLFFWLYKNRHIANRQRTVLWLNGGPGCSSMDGAMMEIGPYRVGEGGNLTYNNGSWDEFANVLFVDNPVGTGFSYVDSNSYLHELDEMANNMVSFLETFFTLFPEHETDDLYIAGESYAGQHIPHIASAILDRNALKTHHAWNLSGLLIGNGWISGPDQYLSYIPFAYESGLVTSGSDHDKQLLEQQKDCIRDLDKTGKDHVDVATCEAILQDILRVSMKDGKCVNMYDVRLTDSYPSCGMNWPPDLSNVTPYLRRKDVIRALNINRDKKTGWEECNGQVSNAFKAANSKPSVKLLPGLLEKVPIVLFSGDQDLICNHIGTENLISSLEWNGAVGMETEPGHWAPKRDWSFEGQPAGIYQSARNLTYVKFYNSSHMVPFDYPRRTRDMLDRFMGVDIASIGGQPADSRIDGEKAHPETSVAQNSTLAQEAEDEKVQAAKWSAYQRSGEAALAIMVIAVVFWGYFIWRARRRRAGYRSVFGSDPYDGGLGLDGHGSRGKFREDPDVEAAREYDESELDDLGGKRRRQDLEEEPFDVGDDEDEEDAGDGGRGSGRAH
ncbi:Pheromone-processing carboxypeptidase kex1 [Salinomyces thailandicus]|uniref:Carboxypeptidase n=1 Tax=Salinomyces thailandicus TaxID=706561 RepID=A0A4U0TNI0_9PEZI|nr:Pheromone-processing carboxypeptidase kex1 [Salinomyces thailandica]